MAELKLEHIIRDKLADYEVPPTQNAWKDFESKAGLPGKSAGLLTSATAKIALIATLFVVPALGIYFLMDLGKSEKEKLLNKEKKLQEINEIEKAKIDSVEQDSIVIDEKTFDKFETEESEAKQTTYYFNPVNDGKQIYFGPAEANMDNIKKFRMIIRDQNGRLIFQSNSPLELWDGKVQDKDVFARNGTYNWFIVIEKEDNQVYKRRGKVDLVR